MNRRPGKWIILIAGCVAISLVGYVDSITAQKYSLYIFYAVPIFLGAWFAGPAAGILFSSLSVFMWMVVEFPLSPWEPLTILWNAGLRLCFFIGISTVISSLKATLEREKASAGIDFLTELPNRRTFFAVANQERDSAIRHRRPLTLAYIDLDDFKEMNDRSGHDVGDILLKEVGLVLKENVRSSDCVARIGGDEFVVLFPETNFESGQTAIRKLVDAWKVRMLAKHWNISVSVGAVTYTDRIPDIMEMVSEADRFMYEAKASGKNRILHEQVALSGS